MKAINKSYVSEIDLFLQEFDKKHPKSMTQQAEINKYKKINQLRDIPNIEQKEKKLWEGF